MFNCIKKRKYEFPIIEDYYDMDNDLEYVKSIAEILKDTNYMLYNIYKYNKKIFAIFIQQYGYPWDNNEYYFHTYELPSFQSNIACSSSVLIHLDNKSIELNDLNTYEYYRRQRHASKHIELVKQFASDLLLSTIYGKIEKDTDIGYENLKHFYEKNGFKVSQYDFIFKSK